MPEMRQPITATYIVTPAEVKRAQVTASSVRDAEPADSKVPEIIAYGILGIFVSLMFLFQAGEQNVSFEIPAASDIFLVSLLFVLIFAAWAIFRYTQYYSFKKDFAKLPLKEKRVEYLFSENEVCSKTKGVFEGTHQWSSYVKVVRTTKGFLFYSQPHLYAWIPNHAFQSKEDAQAVAELARQFAPQFFEV
jgi:hypothetical protein